MTRSRIITALGSAVVAVALIAVVSGAFTADERKVIRELRTRIIALEQQDIAQNERMDDVAPVIIDLDARLSALEDAQAPFTFTGITVHQGGSTGCDPSTCVDISWNVEPCATGQIEYGTTTDYGSVTTLETDLLCFHRQRIGGLTPDTTYHFRIIATDGAGAIAREVVTGTV